MKGEPILREEDRRAWNVLQKKSLIHSKLNCFDRRVRDARKLIEKYAKRGACDPCVMWSAGKDSTALTHLVQEIIPGVKVYSQKDDIDFPGEKEYLFRVSSEWEIDLEIIEPDFSVLDSVMEIDDLNSSTDIHSRASEVAQKAFYELVEEASNDHDLTILGLRKQESVGRKMNSLVRGDCYLKKDGERILNPISSWTNDDLFAYLFSRDIEIFSVYKCIGFMHRHNPARLRKSWWIPSGVWSNRGKIAWLRRYYPSLYRKIRDLSDFSLWS